MNFNQKYILEYLRLKHWNIFLKKCVNDISQILSQNELNEVITYKIEQKTLYYIIYLIGICKQSSYIFFLKTSCITDNKDILKEDILHNWIITDNDFDRILFIIIKHNSNSKKELKKEFNLVQKNPHKISLNKIIKNNQIILKIKSDLFPSTTKISSADYSRLKTLFIGDQSIIDKHICLLLTRYNFFGYLKEGICLSANIVYDFIHDQDLSNQTLEAFAGTLNSNLPNYCSLFYDLESKFGSKGSFLQTVFDCSYKCIVSNPPYLANVMNKSSNIIIKYLDKCNDLNVIIIIPDWRSAEEYIEDKNIQISINEHEQERQNVSYTSYTSIRKSKYFRKVITIGNYEYYNFFASSYKKIRDNTLFIILSSDAQSDMSTTFIKYIEKKIKIRTS